MRNLIIITTFILSSTVYAQKHWDRGTEKPKWDEKFIFSYSRDFNNILLRTKQDTSAIYYPKLFKRFMDWDYTLTNYEIVALEIGFTENKNYFPYQDVEIEKKIQKLNEISSFDEAIRICDSLIAKSPFNIVAIREKSYAYNKIGQIDSSNIYNTRYAMLAISNMSTGDGSSYEKSRFVLFPGDGRYIIRNVHNRICFEGSGKDKKNNLHDIYGVQFKLEKTNKDTCIIGYFNIGHAAKRDAQIKRMNK